MDLKPQIPFPTQQEKLAREVLEQQARTGEERVMVLFELSALSEAIRASSPVRERQTQVLDEVEEREHSAWKELLTKHARGIAERDDR